MCKIAVMRVADLVAAMERVAPVRLAETWDNVGLLCGDPEQALSAAILTIDYTPPVAEEARRLDCEAVIAYHPPIFHPLKRIVAGGVVYDAIRRGVAIYSPHTALDVADGGTNDVLCDVLGVASRAPLKIAEGKLSHVKLVTFVPEEAADRVADAMFAAGAGRIGNYTSCSFRSPGVGTFFGEPGTTPAVGQSQRLERAPEIRLETLVPQAAMFAVVNALRRWHPYEEPAFDLAPLAPPPSDVGLGRIGRFSEPIERAELLTRIKAGLRLERLLVAGPESGAIASAAVCAGACGDLFQAALSAGAGLFLTGEMRHHDALQCAQAGMTVVCTLHSNSERIALANLARRLTESLAGVNFHLSQSDRDPFSIR